MFFKRLSFAFFLACTTLTMTYPKLDVRYLRGSYKNLKPEYRKFSILRGAVALKKIESKFLFSDEKLIKQLFHHLNLVLVAPAAPDRVATYLSIDRIAKILVLMHGNFKEEALLELKEKILSDYKEKNVKVFTKRLNQFFSTTKDAFKENADNTFQAFLALAFLKINSKTELNQYHKALEAALKVKKDDLFCFAEDEKFYEESTTETIVNQLTSQTINGEFITELIQNTDSYEETICALELANQSRELPQAIDYIFNSEFEKNWFPNCFESSFLNFLQAILFDPQTSTCSLENLKKYNVDPEAIDEKLYNFYTQAIQCGDKLISPCNPYDAGSKISQNAFNQVVCNRPWIIYRNETSQSGHKSNLIKIPDDILINKEFCNKLQSHYIDGIKDSSPQKLFEIASDAKNFIILADQLLKLNLFEDSLEKIYFQSFEEYYLAKLMNRLGLQYTFEKVNNQIITIEKPSKYSFVLTFSGFHTTYQKHAPIPKQYKLNVHFSEINQADKLFAQSFINTLVSQTDKNGFIKNYPHDPCIGELLYLNDLKDEAVRLNLLDTLLSTQTNNPLYIELAKKIILFPHAPLNDYQYRNNFLSSFFPRDRFEDQNFFQNKNITSVQKELAHNEDVKMVLICLAGLHKDNDLLNSVSSFYLGEHTFNEKTFFDYLVQKTKPEKIVYLIQLMAKYEENNHIITLTHAFLSQCKNAKFAQQVSRIMQSTQNQEVKDALQTALFKNTPDTDPLSQAKEIVDLYAKSNNKFVISHLLEIFEKLHQADYPIENIKAKLCLNDNYISVFARTENKKKIEFFKWAIQKKLCINEALNTAINSIEKSSEEHLGIIEALLKNNTSDGTIADKLVLTFQNQNGLSSSYTVKFIKLFLDTNEISKKLILPYAFSGAKKICQQVDSSSLELFDFLLSKNINTDEIIKLFQEINEDTKFKELKNNGLDLKLAKLLIKHNKHIQHTQIIPLILTEIQSELKKNNIFGFANYKRYRPALEIFKIFFEEKLMPLEDLCLLMWNITSCCYDIDWEIRTCATKLFQDQHALEYLAKFLFENASEFSKLQSDENNFYIKLLFQENNRDKFFEYCKLITFEKIKTNEAQEFINIVNFFKVMTEIKKQSFQYVNQSFWKPLYSDFIIPSIAQLINCNYPDLLQKALVIINSILGYYSYQFDKNIVCEKEVLLPLATNIIERMCSLRENIFCLEGTSLISQLNTSPEVLYDYANHFLSLDDNQQYSIGLKTLRLLVEKGFYIQEALDTINHSLEKNIENDDQTELMVSLIKNYKKYNKAAQCNLIELCKEYLNYLQNSNSFSARYKKETEKMFMDRLYDGITRITKFIYKNSDYSSPDYLLHFAFEPLKLMPKVNGSHGRFLNILHDEKIDIELSQEQQSEILNFLRDMLMHNKFEDDIVLILRKFIQQEYCLELVKELVEALKESTNDLIKQAATHAEEELLAKTSHAGARRARLPGCPTDDGQQAAKKMNL